MSLLALSLQGYDNRPAKGITKMASETNKKDSSQNNDFDKDVALPDTPLRLSKLMAIRGLCSRREADELIVKGWVKVNGLIIDELGSKVLPDAKIELHPSASKRLDSLMTILLNKPIGYVSGTPEDDYEPAVRLITAENHEPLPDEPELEPGHFEGLAPAGRLDIDSQGLIVFTQNGMMAKLLIGENTKIEKEYLVRVKGTLSKTDLALLNHGLSLDDRPLKPAYVEWVNEDQLRFVLKEGRKRQIRRMCEQVGLQVIGLKRVRIGKVRLSRLSEGKWRFLSPNEEF
jgi:23S rRNA pseudouridine2604 synthase